jgi:predicted nucleic acid-binding protein
MTTAVLVDTDVLYLLLRGDSRGTRYCSLLNGRALVISFVTLAESETWAEAKEWDQDVRLALRGYLQRCIIRHSDEILCQQWAQIIAAAARIRCPISAADAWQAAVAVLYGIPLVTDSRRHYDHVPGLTLLTYGEIE